MVASTIRATNWHISFGQLIHLYKMVKGTGGEMRPRADDVKKRIAKRKREREKLANKLEANLIWVEDEEKHGFERISTFEGGPSEDAHPLFRKEIFLFKALVSACLVLIVAIVFRYETNTLSPIKGFVTKSMEQSFQFAAIADWYEEAFGKPLALLPLENKGQEQPDPQTNLEYALPASARILEDFRENGQRITIETPKDATVAAMNEGRVIFAGMNKEFGKTVIIQHTDKSETWYGNLNTIEVGLYELVEKGANIGVATNNIDGMAGTFYFAIKQGDDFIDPIQVIQFD